ncbi:Transthyretin-like family protein [Aphelenchoides fujianensis]|nr:Transthyretin-like family protein [Aphelenchoides fujianensis]
MKVNALLLAGLSALFVLHFCDAHMLGRTQSVAVIGRIFCNGNWTETPATVVLWDRDLTDADDKMGEVKTGDHGSFYVQGFEKELTAIDPEIRIHATCPDVPPCVKIEIPAEWIESGPQPSKIFDTKTIELTLPGQNVC